MSYRGRGIGHAVFDAARPMRGRWDTAMRSSRRSSGRPANAPNLGPFRRKRGYAPLDRATARLSWRDVDDADETEKPLGIWIRALEAPEC